MNIPFTTEQFLKVFETYNLNYFPAQIVFLIAGLIVLGLLHDKKKDRSKHVYVFLGIIWIWTGLAYHIVLFSDINTAAFVFGSLFILQGVMTIFQIFKTSKPEAENQSKYQFVLGEFLVLFGLLIYPAIGYLIEANPAIIISFGLPCPTTIASFGFFLMMTNKLPRYLLIIPALWALIGFTAAFNFGVYQDVMLPISAIICLIFLLRKRKN